MKGKATKTTTLSRVSLKIEDGNITLLDDKIEVIEQDLLYEVLDQRKLPGYKLKYVMKNSLHKVIQRPQRKANHNLVDHYVIYTKKSERKKFIGLLISSIEDSLKAIKETASNSLTSIGKLKGG